MNSVAWPKDLRLLAQEGFLLKGSVDHGVGHWARVRANGVRLASMCRVNPMVPSLFGLFHDCRREDEYLDHGHGSRAAEFVEHLASRGKLDRYLAAREVSWLVQACAEHSDGLVHGPLAVQVCFDADRLDLGRVGIRPDPQRLCTPAARQLLDRSYDWSLGRPWRQDADEWLEDEQPPRRVRPRR